MFRTLDPNSLLLLLCTIESIGREGKFELDANCKLEFYLTIPYGFRVLDRYNYV